MGFSTAGKNAMLESGTGGGVGGVITHLSLHTGDPGDTGANEVSGGSPAYARKTVAWAAASAGQRSNSGAIAFDVPASTTVFYVGFWSALTGGTNYGFAPIGAALRGLGTAAATGDVITSNGHGLSNTNRVIVHNFASESLPAGLTEGTAYFVVGATTDTFQVALTSGGSAVDITGNGELLFQRITPETFGSQGTLNLGVGVVTLDATTV